MIAQRALSAASSARRPMGIQAALEWAFGREHARLDLDVADPEVGARQAVGAEHVIWERHMLGATIDQGGPAFGGSLPHSDAEVIAAFVANLSVPRGGRSMAVRIAELARAGITPDWMPGARVRCVPVGWSAENQHGQRARTEVLGKATYVDRGRVRRYDMVVCPVTYTPSAAQISSARRGYLAWWGALLDLSLDLRVCGMLAEVEITDVMPPLEPWLREGA